MKRVLLGGLAGLLLVSGAYLLVAADWTAEPVVVMPPPEPVDDGLPLVDPGDLRGPEPPEATELTREQRRFARFDRNRDNIITREELLTSRTKAFRKLDTDGNNLLTFEEWAVATSDRFRTADANGDEKLDPREFATTRPAKAPARCAC